MKIDYRKGGMVVRINLISTLFADVSALNASDPTKRPQNFDELKEMWTTLLSINEIPHCRSVTRFKAVKMEYLGFYFFKIWHKF